MVGFYIIFALLLVQISGVQRFCKLIEKHSKVKHLKVHTKVGHLNKEFFECLGPIFLKEIENATITESDYSSLHLFVLDHLDKELVNELRENMDPYLKKKKDIYVIFKVNSMVNSSTLTSLFQELWRKQILNAVLVDKEEKMFTYEPFTSNGFAVTEFVIDKNYKIPDKLSNLHRHEIKVSMFNETLRAIREGNRYVGVDGRLAHNILRHINATVKYISPTKGLPYGLISRNGISGSLGDIAYKKVDVSFNSRLVDEEEKLFYESLYPVQNEIVCVLYPKSQSRPPYLNLIRAFGFNIWALLILLFIVVVLIFKIFRTVALTFGYTKFNQLHRSFSDFELFFKVFLGEAFKDYSRFSSLRIYLITWILFSYVCTTIYFARLESAFVQPAYDEDFNSLRNLTKIKGSVYTPIFFLHIAKKNLNSNLFKVVEERAVIVKDMSRVLTLNPPRNSTFIVLKRLAKYIIQQTFDFNAKRPAFHISEEYLHTSSNVYIVAKGSPYTRKFDELLSKYNDFGFLLHWDKLTRLGIILESKEKPRDDEELNDIIADKEPEHQDLKKVLTMDVLQGAFYLWLIGISSALIIFLIEFRKKNAFC